MPGRYGPPVTNSRAVSTSSARAAWLSTAKRAASFFFLTLLRSEARCLMISVAPAKVVVVVT
jgi:hypothetical protein